MKRKFAFVIIAVMMLSLTACRCEHEFDEGIITKEATCSEEGIRTYTCTLCEEENIESIPCIPHEYEESVEKEPTFDSTGILKYTCKNCGDSYTKDIPKKERTVVVTVVDKKNIPEDIYNGRFSDSVSLVFNVENQCDKPVRGISGVLHIQDLFEKDILSIKCDFTGTIFPASESVTIDELSMEINPFMDDHKKFYDEDFSDLNFRYEISDIIYDETTEFVEPDDKEDMPVDVQVKDKRNVPKDIYNGLYSPLVNFDFDVLNHTDKDIKGVSGVLTAKDMFGKDIISFGCDFTGQTIAAGSTVRFSDLGIEINEFMDDHLKLYHEQYSDLIFDYKINSIVYTNGEKENFE